MGPLQDSETISAPGARNLRRDRRIHQRIFLSLAGRFMNSGREDHGVLTHDVSCGGAFFQSAHRPSPGDRIVCYLDQLGRVDAVVIRATDDGFAAKFNTTKHKQDKLADKLIWLLNKDKLGLREERGAPRHADGGPALVEREDGRHIQCRVVDISLTGAGFETDGVAPLVGEIIRAGNLTGEVVRRAQGEFGVRFLSPLSVGQEQKPSIG